MKFMMKLFVVSHVCKKNGMFENEKEIESDVFIQLSIILYFIFIEIHCMYFNLSIKFDLV